MGFFKKNTKLHLLNSPIYNHFHGDSAARCFTERFATASTNSSFPVCKWENKHAKLLQLMLHVWILQLGFWGLGFPSELHVWITVTQLNAWVCWSGSANDNTDSDNILLSEQQEGKTVMGEESLFKCNLICLLSFKLSTVPSQMDRARQRVLAPKDVGLDWLSLFTNAVSSICFQKFRSFFSGFFLPSNCWEEDSQLGAAAGREECFPPQEQNY